MNNEWLQGIATSIRENKDPLNRDNYRPVALLKMIYKIRAIVVGDRHTTLPNLLTDEAQTAYKPNRYTVDILSKIEKDVKVREKE